ncbi:MAG: DUF4988 domain-containing protein [Bacteroides sp.]|nr:DUF4988 domain-containing protein [Bacteroides sp.]
MNKKFLSAILFGALMVTSTGTFVSCKDYDDDIDRIDKELSGVKETIASLDAAIKAGKFVQSCNEVTGGYELVFTDGSKVTIKNGTNGTNGEAGATIIPEFRVEGNYWQVSTDKGATWVDVKDTEGNKVPARGQDGEAAGSNVSWVTVDGVEYIKIGDKVTDLKQNNEFPNIAVDAESKTVIVTIDGQNYTLLQEGSAFKGLQTVVYRKQAVDDWDDVCKAYDIYWQENEESFDPDKDVLFASVPAYASFKVYPGDFSLNNAKFSFVDTYKLSRSVAPALTYMEGSAKLENGILSLAILPNEGIETYSTYATSLDVTMYGQYTSASDYFTVSRTKASVKSIVNAFTSTNMNENEYPAIINVDGDSYDGKSYGCFDYQGTYNVNDSIDAYISGNAKVWLKSTNISYSRVFRLLDQNEDYTFNGQSIKTRQGIFEFKDDVLSVKSTNQASAIDEYAAIEVTTTVKPQEEGVKEYEVKNVVFIKAVRPAVNPVFGSVALKPLDAKENFAFAYNSSKAQIITLDARNFEAAIEGRDVIANDNDEYCTFITLNKPVYDAGGSKLVRYESISGQCNQYYWNNGLNQLSNIPAKVTELAKALETIENEAVLYYKNGGNNADKDSLFLILTPGANFTQFKNMSLLAGNSSYYPGWGATEKMTNGVNTPYAVYNSFVSKLFKVSVDNFSVTYNFDCPIKDEYKSRTIIGTWTKTAGAYSKFIMESNNFDKMYNVVPEDATVEFELDYKKQNAYVQEMMKEQNGIKNIRWEGNKIIFTPRVDLAKVGTLKVDIYDATAGSPKRVLFTTEDWKVEQPILTFSALVDLKYNNAALATDDQIKIIDLINGLKNAADKKKWTDLTLKDAVGNTLVKYNGTTIAAEETIAETLYRKDANGNDVTAAIGLKISLDENEKDFDYDAATATLTWKGKPDGTVYTHDVNLNITYTHNWGVVTKTFKVTVTRKVQ